jgi:fructose-1,6-bisphosphatase I
MSELGTSVNRYILQQQHRFPDARGDFSEIMTQIAAAAKVVSREVRKAGLVDILGFTGTRNVQGEKQKKLDIFANEAFIEALSQNCHIAALASEEDEDIVQTPRQERSRRYVVSVDPLDGSSNIDVNVSVGTIFSVHRRVSDGETATAEDLLQPGSRQAAAGYVLYGSSTMLVYSTGYNVQGFTLDPSVGEFLLSHENMRIPARGRIYSVNEGNAAFWDERVCRYVTHLKRNTNANGKPYSLRYIGSLVADFHRTLLYGGIFLYPLDYKTPGKPSGKLRLLYEAAPLAYVAKSAGGRASDGTRDILDIQPERLHQRVPLFIGSPEDVAEAEAFMRGEREGATA